MSVKEIRDVLQQLNEPNEFIMEEVNLADVNHYIWKISNCKIKDMNNRFDNLRPDHSRFDVFINGQFILDADFIKFKKENFSYALVGSDKISVEGDLQRL